MTSVVSQRDVVFTPFMLRVRDAVNGTSPEPTKLRFEPSGTCSIAAAVDEWFGLRTYAEHMISEANAMLDADAERIELRDECGTGVLAFELSWRGRRLRLSIDIDPPGHTARLTTGDDHHAQTEKPSDIRALDDIIIDMLIQAGEAVDDT
ncbi:hypothetical protein [[Mycobacterium] crassicus]|uniref:Uncharacterized protein n=1 Tax=[Mycobacterium] crassicus TaxID=2872309 RepID=A0ABU5XIK2_9MYCO|nr:hypothetical protein [Mycolicibacter sp. MYC098]MEB3022118.1 hypothetical protein [Mycolicibacter sp. MYC098]